MSANDAARSAFEMKPGEVSRKSADQRLNKRQTHHQQSRWNRIEFWLNPGADHIGQRNRQGSAKHQIRNDAQRGQKNSQAEKKKGQCEPFDTAEIGRDLRLRRCVHRLKKSFAENSVINHRPIDEPAEAWCAVNLAAPFRSAGRAEENQVFETQKRLGFAITLLLLQKFP